MAQRDIFRREIDLTVKYGARLEALDANGLREKRFYWLGSEIYLRLNSKDASRLRQVVVIANDDEDTVKTVFRSDD